MNKEEQLFSRKLHRCEGTDLEEEFIASYIRKTNSCNHGKNYEATNFEPPLALKGKTCREKGKKLFIYVLIAYKTRELG